MSKEVRHFMGQDGFVWFLGIVEDRKDPLHLGRCRVRCFGWHTEDKSLLPTEDLPWAMAMNPISEGSHTHPPREYDLVCGFFLDGHSAQHPVMMGVIPGQPPESPPNSKGFSSPPYKDQPLKPVTRNIVSGGGYTGTNQDPTPYPRIKAQVDSQPIVFNESPEVSRLARHQQVQFSMIPGFLNDNIVTADSVKGTIWKEPGPGYNSQYPYNHARETESGHVFELDDTKDNERVSLFHRTGTGTELLVSGTRHDKTVKDAYDIIHGNSMNWVGGKIELVVENVAKVHIKGATTVEIDNDADIKIAGKLNLSVGKDFNIKTGGSINFDIGKSWTDITKQQHFTKSGNDYNLIAGGNFNYDASTVYAQSGKTSGSSPAGISTTLNSTIPSITSVSTQLSAVSAAVQSGVPVSAMSGSLSAISTQCGAIGATISGTTTGLGALASSATSAIGGVVPAITAATSVVGQAQAAVAGVENAAQSAAAGLLTGAVDTVTSVATTMASQVTSRISNIIAGGVSDVVSEIGNINGILGQAQHALSTVTSGLDNLVGSVVGQVAGIASPNAFIGVLENAVVPEINHLVGAPISAIVNFDPSQNPLDAVVNTVLTAARPIVVGASILADASSIITKVQNLGFTAIQATALASHMMHFSNFNPQFTDPVTGGFGLLGFTGNRLTGLINYSVSTGGDISNIDTQLGYMKVESTPGAACSYSGDDLSDGYHSALALGTAPEMSVKLATNVANVSPTQSMVDYAAAFNVTVLT